MNLKVSVISLAITLGISFCLAEEAEESMEPRAFTPLGTIEGHYKTTRRGRRLEAYEGIPYAHPPIGDSRFEIAKPISPWTGILKAKQYGPPCMQYSYAVEDPTKRVEGSEDCLYLNIYSVIKENDTPDPYGNVGTSDLLPVIFYIHGGAFQFGTGMHHGPDYLLERDVVLVNINYRLGPLGFLSTEDEIVPGNMGLKDQSMALRWVADNIRFFGGDPARVTIFGQSAGGASVHYHYLSKLSYGLFHAGMSLSGCALNCWTQTEKSLEKAVELATLVGCPNDDVPRMVECLKTRPAHQIVRHVENFMPWANNPHTPFGPVVEKAGKDLTFIDKSPIDIISSGKAHDVPWVTGIVSEEALYPAAEFITDKNRVDELNNVWDTIAPHLLDYYYTIPKGDHAKVSKLIKQHYLGNGTFGKATIDETIRMISDRLFIYDCKTAAKLQAQANRRPVQFYYFSYRGEHSLSEVLSGTDENFGVSHEDDLAYVFQLDINQTTTLRDRAMQKKLIDLWVTFASKGTPDMDIDWPKLNKCSDDFPYLHIAGPDEIDVKKNLTLGEGDFWYSLGFRENIYSDTESEEKRNRVEL